MDLTLLQSGGDSALGLFVLLLFVGLPLLLVAVVLAGQWKAHEKADIPGWTALVPFYGFYRRAKRTDNPGWYTALLFVPFANLFAAAKVNADFVDLFGKGFVFAVGLAFLPFVFWPLLGFGDYTTGGRGVY
jgi:glycopeptide antibiotics resistance protein